MNSRTSIYNYLLYFLVLSTCLNIVYAQNSEFEKLFEEATKQQYSAPDKSLVLYEYLLKSNLDVDTQFLVYTQQLETFQILGQYGKSVETLLKLNKLAPKISDNEKLYRYWLEIASLYYDLDFIEESQKMLLKAEEYFETLSETQKNKNFKLLKYGHYTFQVLDNEWDKINGLKEIQDYWKEDTARYSWNAYMLGEFYFTLHKDSAALYFKRVLKYENPLLDSLAELNLSLLQDKPKEEVVAFMQTIEGDKLSYRLKSNVLKHMITYWESKKESDSLIRYIDKLDSLKEENLLIKRQAKTLLLEEIYHNKELEVTLTEEKLQTRQIQIILGLSLLTLAYVVLWFYRKDKRKRKELQKLEKNKGVVMPDKTEEDILLRLNEFEKSTLFLDKQIRIATLAKHLNTNIRYLSVILNKTKNKSFNSYINQLRIEYILDKLHNDSQYLNYKISYLAEESGFASQSSFSASFKDITGMSPSIYIKKIIDEKSK